MLKQPRSPSTLDPEHIKLVDESVSEQPVVPAILDREQVKLVSTAVDELDQETAVPVSNLGANAHPTHNRIDALLFGTGDRDSLHALD